MWNWIFESTGIKNASPRNWPEVYTAMAEALSCAGNQLVTTLLLIGNAGASRAPVAILKPNSEAKPFAKPWNTVASDQLTRLMV